MNESVVTDTNQVPDLETGYRQYRPMLFSAIGRFVRQGVRISPADTLDFVHDFFTEEWYKLAATYDPQKGRFEPYVYAAFVNFVRPRVYRLSRLQRDLFDPDLLNSFASGVNELPPDPTLQAAQFGAALQRVSTEHRDLLLAYLHGGQTPERMLARRLGIPRYRLREKLIAALGQFAVLINSSGVFSERDRDVAWALWGEERSISEAARLLGMTEAQVRVAHRRNTKLLTSALQRFQQSQKGAGRTASGSTGPLELLDRAIGTRGNKEILKSLRENAPLVLRAIEESEDDGDVAVDELDPLWSSQVMDALVGHELPDPGKFSDVLFDSETEDRRRIGDVLEHALIAELPEDLKSWSRWSGRLARVREERRAELLRDASVQASPYAQEVLSWFGMTPITVLTATDAIPALVKRLGRKGRIDDSKPVNLPANSAVAGGSNSLAADLVASEVALSSGQSSELALCLVEWCVSVAHFKPFLFIGFEAFPAANGQISLCKIRGSMNLWDRWARRQAH